MIYAYVLGFPTDKTVTIHSLGRKTPQMNGTKIKSITMLGCDKKIKWQQQDDALVITMPDIPSTNMTIGFEVKTSLH